MPRLSYTRRKLGKTHAKNLEALGPREPFSPETDGLNIETIPTVCKGLGAVRQYYQFQGKRAPEIQTHIERNAMNGGDPDTLAHAVDHSQALIDKAIASDNRLARRPQWQRAEDGIFADAGLVASGDDSPCYDMTRAALAMQATAGSPARICISTDGSTPTSLAAFIATARIVQQFRPLEIWHQGAWLADNGYEAGYVFLTPLIQNDWDYSRIQFFLSDPARDHYSFCLLYNRCVMRDRRKIKGIGTEARRAYLDGAIFVDHHGIPEAPEAIAETAAQWLELTPRWETDYKARKAQTASLQALPEDPGTRPDYTITQADRDRWDREAREAEEKRKQESAQRLQTAGAA